MISYGKKMCAYGTGLALVLSGCANGQLARPEGPAVLDDALEIEAASVDIKCEVVKPSPQLAPEMAAALPAAVAAIGINFAVDVVGGLLKDAQAKRNAVWSASGVAADCTPKAAGGINRGDLTIRRAVLDRSGQVVGSSGFTLTGSLTFTRSRVPAGDKTKDVVTVDFTPTSFDYGRTAAPTRGSGRKHVVVLLALSENPILKASEATGKEDNPLALRIDLGTVADGRGYSAAMIGHARALTVMPASDAGRLLATAIVVESEDELIALRALTDAYDGNKDDLAEALRNALGVGDK